MSIDVAGREKWLAVNPEQMHVDVTVRVSKGLCGEAWSMEIKAQQKMAVVTFHVDIFMSFLRANISRTCFGTNE